MVYDCGKQSLIATHTVQLTSKCHHINADLSLCNNKNYSYYCNCRKHRKDICTKKYQDIQSKRLAKIRKNNLRLAQTGILLLDPDTVEGKCYERQ